MVWQSGACDICANTSTTLLYRRISQWKSIFLMKATEQMLLLIKQIAEREGVTEQLKAQDQMLWVQRMNNIRDRAMEIVEHELIYT